MNLADSWVEAKKAILENIGESSYEAWISRLQAREAKPGVLLLAVADEFSREWISKHYLGLIEDVLKKVAGQSFRVELLTQPANAGLNPSPKEPHNALEKAPPSLPASSPHGEALGRQAGLNLNPRYTFDNFVVGPSNRFAHAASIAVSASPAKAYNPLFIYGGVGLGKTHLMQAICHCILSQKTQNLKICYLPSEKFTNVLIDAIQHHSTARFRQKYRNMDVLVMDDVHFIAGKESTQEEFFHTFNALYDAHKQIIISSNCNPKDIPNLEERLVSRFGWGLITDIQAPDFETRVAILKKKIERESINIPDEVIFFIAQIVKTNIRELEGALIRVMAYSLLGNKPITLELTKDILKDFLKENNKTITIDLIQKEVGVFFNLTTTEIKGNKRDKNTVFARQVAMYLSRELTNFSLPEIGGFFGGKDHTTVLHSYNKIKDCLFKNHKLKADLEKITQGLKQ